MVRTHPHARTRDKHKIKDSLTTYFYDGHKVHLIFLSLRQSVLKSNGNKKNRWVKIGWEGNVFTDLFSEFSDIVWMSLKRISSCCKMSDYLSLNTRLAPNQWTEYREFVVLQHGSWFCPGCNLPKCHSWDTQAATSDPASNAIVGNAAILIVSWSMLFRQKLIFFRLFRLDHP